MDRAEPGEVRPVQQFPLDGFVGLHPDGGSQGYGKVSGTRGTRARRRKQEGEQEGTEGQISFFCVMILKVELEAVVWRRTRAWPDR